MTKSKSESKRQNPTMRKLKLSQAKPSLSQDKPKIRPKQQPRVLNFQPQQVKRKRSGLKFPARDGSQMNHKEIPSLITGTSNHKKPDNFRSLNPKKG